MQNIGLNPNEVQQLTALIARLDAKSARHAQDRRNHPRIDFSHPMWLNLPSAPGQPWVHVYSRNLSTSGLAFLTRALFYAQQHLVISHELTENVPMLVLCQVCLCRPVACGIQEVGLRFVAAQADPGYQRLVPSHWMTLAARQDYFARHFAAAGQ